MLNEGVGNPSGKVPDPLLLFLFSLFPLVSLFSPFPVVRDHVLQNPIQSHTGRKPDQLLQLVRGGNLPYDILRSKLERPRHRAPTAPPTHHLDRWPIVDVLARRRLPGSRTELL